MTDLYSRRCNDPAEKQKWQNSGLVPVGTLSRGQKFECICGKIHTFEDRDRSRMICHTRYDDTGLPGMFGETARVRPLEHVRHVEIKNPIKPGGCTCRSAERAKLAFDDIISDQKGDE